MLRNIPLFALFFFSSSMTACSVTPLYMPTHSWSQVDDLDVAIRQSGASDLPCALANVTVDRVAIARGYRQPQRYLYFAEGCGTRVTYVERCDTEPVIPPGLTEEQAARKRAATLDTDRELTCHLVAIGHVPLQGAPPRTTAAIGAR